MQQSSTDLLASPAHLRTLQQSSAPISARLELPARDITAKTIEDAFVQFILVCNPGVPIEADTAALRESFRTPPKSGGKSFDTWVLFELIAQFQSKEIKTWGELALKLGVEPPDQDKGQSSQKIQQYAVRLKVKSPVAVRTGRFWIERLNKSMLTSTNSAGCTLCTSMLSSSTYWTIHTLTGPRFP